MKRPVGYFHFLCQAVPAVVCLWGIYPTNRLLFNWPWIPLLVIMLLGVHSVILWPSVTAGSLDLPANLIADQVDRSKSNWRPVPN